MLTSAAILFGMKAVSIVLVVLGKRADTAPTEKIKETEVTGFKPSDHLTIVSRSSADQVKSSKLPGQSPKRLLSSTATTGLDKIGKNTGEMAIRAVAPGVEAERSHIDTYPPNKQAVLKKIISALEELHKTFNSTLSSQITIISRANGKNPGRKSKLKTVPAEEGVKPTTATLSAVESTASRASADVLQSLAGRNFRKSHQPQTKKTNKRVCFWKYCSQN